MNEARKRNGGSGVGKEHISKGGLRNIAFPLIAFNFYDKYDIKK